MKEYNVIVINNGHTIWEMENIPADGKVDAIKKAFERATELFETDISEIPFTQLKVEEQKKV